MTGRHCRLLGAGIIATVAASWSLTAGDAAGSRMVWTPTLPMNDLMRAYHTAVLLPDGRVLVAGGESCDTSPLTACPGSAELYDPGANSWASTPPTATPRSMATATVLGDGTVLVAGGNPHGATSAELYHPSTGSWSVAAAMLDPVFDHTATLLPDGKVLVAGGATTCIMVQPCWQGNDAELYNPATASWSMTGSMVTAPPNLFVAARQAHTATLLPGGRVLVAGGWVCLSGSCGQSGTLSTVEIYDETTGTWSVGASMKTPRYDHTATLLRDGDVLVSGGVDRTGHVWASAELYHPATGTWTATGSMHHARFLHTATLLTDGRVLVTGGDNLLGDLAEIYDPGTGTWSNTTPMLSPRFGHTATLLPGGTVLAVGGLSPAVGAEVYGPLKP